MNCGYAGQYIEIDLTKNTIKKEQLEKSTISKYIGGAGFTARALYEDMNPLADPLGPENILCFAPGVLVGTNVPTANRTVVSAKSPLTGFIGAANSGSYWGSELKYAGYDGIIIKGRASSPVYIYVDNEQIEIISAHNLRGKGTWETIELIRQEHMDKKIQVACIGQAGENLCRFASIQNGLYDAWERTGMGAVMGSKNLKAVAVRGTGSIHVYDRKGFLNAVADCRDTLCKSPLYRLFVKYGTLLNTVPYLASDALAGRNFQVSKDPGWMEKQSREMVKDNSHRAITCFACPIACGHWVGIEEGPYRGFKLKDFTVNPIVGFAAGCDLDLPAAAKMSELCKGYGLDRVSAAGTIAFAMELYQRGLLKEQDLGFELEWGNAEAIEKLMQMISYREGIGDILAEGTKRAGELIPGAGYFAMHVKGLEISLADPRGHWPAQNFADLTSILGCNQYPRPCLTEKYGLAGEDYRGADIPPDLKKEVYDLDTGEINIIKMTKLSEDLISLYGLMGMCIMPPVLQAMGPPLFSRLYSTLTGQELSPGELMLAGERVWNLQRLFNLRESEDSIEARYPDRFYIEALTGSINKPALNPQRIERSLGEYYSYRGWDPQRGKPLKNKLAELGIKYGRI